MSHQLDFDGMLEKLILLQHFAHGSKQFCQDRLTGSEYDIGDEAFDEYWGWVKVLVSTYILECGIRVRVFLDIISEKLEKSEIIDLDTAARAELSIGQIVDGNFKLTLRETCNKIIHAKKVVPVWTTGMVNDIEFKYWSGQFDLSGTRGSESWQLLLDVPSWAKSIERFLLKADSSELTLYVGQDWY
jgi:hypothetical protein